MITAKVFSVLNFKFLPIRIFSTIIFLCMVGLSFPAYSDYKCTDGKDPEKTLNCSGGRCGICDPNEGWNGWSNPKAEIIYQPGVYDSMDTGVPVYRATMGLGKCSWLFSTRFCIRAAKPKSAQINKSTDAYGKVTTTTTSIAGDPGNTTGDQDVNLGRPQICAYEDPCDGMDPPDGNCAENSSSGPYHENATNPSGVNVEEAALYGAAGGLLGSALGAAVGGITAHYNHIVTRNIGCIDRRIGPTPPTWTNNAWFNNSMPLPSFENTTASVFEAPKIKVKICKSGSSSVQQIVSCKNKDSVEYLSAVLAPAYPNYNDCKTIADGSNNGHGRKFCGIITKNEPDKIALTQVDFSGEITALTPMDRPGYIPQPTVTEATGSTTDAVKITITLRGQSLTLEEKNAGNPNAVTSGILHQVPFVVTRPCATTPPEGSLCPTYMNLVCAIGYNTTPFVAVSKAGNLPVAGLPNNLKPANQAFVNTNAAIEGTGTPLNVSFKEDVWVYKGSGGDIDGKDANGNPVVGTQKLRPMNPIESGMCIYPPADMKPYQYNYSASVQKHTVPKNCTKMNIKVWGAGAAGSFDPNNHPSWDSSGGAGGYANGVNLSVTEGQVLNIIIGKGGSNIGEVGGISYVVTPNNTIIAYGGNNARTGSNSDGGGYSLQGSGLNDSTGSKGGAGLGFSGPGKNAAGGAAHDGSSQPASECPAAANKSGTYTAPFAGGGCGGNDDDSTGTNGSWGKGGDGRAIIQCTASKQ